MRSELTLSTPEAAAPLLPLASSKRESAEAAPSRGREAAAAANRRRQRRGKRERGMASASAGKGEGEGDTQEGGTRRAQGV